MGEYYFEDEINFWEDLHHAHYWKLPFIKHSVSLYRFIINFIHIYAFLNMFTFVCDVYISCNIFLSVTEQGLSQWKEMLHTRCYWVLVQSRTRMCRLARFLYDAQLIYISYIWSVSHMHHHSYSLKKCFIVTVSCQCGLWWCVQAFYNYNQSKLINQGLDSMNNATVSSWKHKHSSCNLSCWVFLKVIKCAFTFSVISQHLASAGSCNRHFCTKRARLVCIVNFLVAGGLDTQGFGASGTMIWT